jgi:DnaK suppressor protein
MSNGQFEVIKRKLLAERKRVLEALHRNMQYALSEFDDSTKDSGDLAAASHDKGLLYGLQEAAVKRLKAIDRMLSRIEEDDYGICQRCGFAIGNARLEALPWATNCRPCQEESDLQELSLSGSQVHELKAVRKDHAA